MQYAILIYENDADFAARSDDARQARYWAGWRAYSQALADSGVRHLDMPLTPYRIWQALQTVRA